MREYRAVWALAVVVFSLAALAPAPALAQETDEPVVFGLLLYSPTCPHCHDFIVNEWPKMHEEFGDQFQLLFINVASEGGRQLAMAVYEVYGIPEGQRYVPMMIIDDNVLVGSIDIPALAPDIIRAGLESGGIDLPPVPGLREAYEQALAEAEARATQEGEQQESAEEKSPQAAAEASEPAAGAGDDGNPEGETTPAPKALPVAEADNPVFDPYAAGEADTLGARLARDPLANALAVGVLLGLAVSAGAVIIAGFGRLPASDGQALAWLSGRPRWIVALLASLAALGIAATLVARTGGNPLAGMLSISTLILLAVATAIILSTGLRSQSSRIDLPGWLIPVLSVAGTAVAIYLTYVEVGQTEAFCGAVGDCNTVQQSQYATLFGLIPVGVLGVVGYVAILLVWGASRIGGGRLADWAEIALLGMTLFGTLFSIYLTFLEPFVIGATCAWCLTAALVMLLLLWLHAPAGLQTLRRTIKG